MSDLRSACIEAMARELAAASFSETNPLTVAALSNGFITDAIAALDALLGVLEEHAPGVGEALDYFDEMGGNTPYGAEIAFDCLNDTQQEAIIRAARLLAVLREDNG